MAAYRRLHSVTVRHGFYAAPDGCRLRFTPTAQAAAWLRRAGCLVRGNAQGLQILHDGVVWPEHEGNDAVALDFLVHAEDAQFYNVTEALRASGNRIALYGTVPRFEHGPAPAGDEPEVLRPAGEIACPRPHVGATAPLLVVTLRPQPTGPGRHCVLPFEARRLVWKYLFVGNWPPQGLQVIDLAKAEPVDFEPAGREPLADGSSALVIRSRSPIAIGERANHKFQLQIVPPRRQGSSDPDVLVERLPVADARQFALEVHADKKVMVSEILVHR